MNGIGGNSGKCGEENGTGEDKKWKALTAAQEVEVEKS